MFQNNAAESNHYGGEKAIETEKIKKCLKSLFTKLENRWLHWWEKEWEAFFSLFLPQEV